MNPHGIISEKVLAAENGSGELFDAYMSVWSNTANTSLKEIESHIARLNQIKSSSVKRDAWHNMANAMVYALWPGTGNAFDQLTRTRNLFLELNDRAGEGAVLAMLSLYYKNLGQLEKALECVNTAINNLKDEPRYLYYLGVAHFQGGDINQVLNDFDTALDYLKRGLAHFKSDEELFKARLLSGIGNIYKDKNDLDQAYTYFIECMRIIEGKNQFMVESKNFADLGNYYLKKGDFEKSLEYQLKSLAIRKELNQTSPIITNYLELAELYLKQNKLNEALEVALIAESLSKEHNVIVKKYQSDLVISNIYEAMGNAPLALEYYKKYHLTKDQVTGQENARKIKQINMHHEIESVNKEKEIFKLRNVYLKQALDEIESSVRYAKRIQEAILPPMEFVASKFSEIFILYKPKDVVAGDFYWIEEVNDTIFIAAADCTGHGVPGAIVSVICSNSLNRVVYEHQVKDPAEILEKTTELVCKTFEKSSEDVKDGMDISLIAFNKKDRTLRWSGANNPLWYISAGELTEIAPVKRPIGKSDLTTPFKSHALQLEPNTTFYLFTDGFADQFGGEFGKKYKYTQLKEKLVSIVNYSADQQHQELSKTFDAWKGELEQVDDVCLIGFRI